LGLEKSSNPCGRIIVKREVANLKKRLERERTSKLVFMLCELHTYSSLCIEHESTSFSYYNKSKQRQHPSKPVSLPMKRTKIITNEKNKKRCKLTPYAEY